MDQYWVQGQYIPRKKNLTEEGKTQNALEPFSRSYWAESPEEAIAAAQVDIDGGKWVEVPVVSLTSEEMRMRAIGAPELPLDFGS